MSAWMEKATRIAGDVYNDFLRQVVDQGVTQERLGPLSKESRERSVVKKTHIDPRVIRLMSISGKGGWHPDVEKWKKYELNTNVTLLDHLLSVLRGALLLYALDKLGQNPDMDTALLEKRLRVIAVVAFLHDLDKSLNLERNTRLPLDEVENAVERYGLAQFLAPETLSAEQVRYLIELVEDTQRHRSPPSELPPRDYDSLMGYVALADKLDSIWLSSDPEKGGLTGVLSHLSKVQTLRTDFIRHWRSVDLFDPHHPFLLDELQRRLSGFSGRLTGILPLIEVHHDGRLFMLLPATDFENIVDKALSKLCGDLPFQLELVISNRGLPALYNGQPTDQALRDFLADLPLREVGRLFLIKADLQEQVTAILDSLMGGLGLAPRWPRNPGALVSLYAMHDDLAPDANIALRKAAHLVLLLNLNAPTGGKTGLPNYTQREEMLLKRVGQERPAWLSAIQDDASRRTLTALWTLVLSLDDNDLEMKIWGEDGLLQHWLEGENGQPGFNQFIEGRGAIVTAAVEQHFRQLLSGKRITVADERAEGRCIFTDEPVPANDAIDEAVGLYEVRVSAFSGRDNRPESITSERAHTNVSPVSVAEYKLRAQVHGKMGGKPDGVPTLISSPSTSGLFGGLGLRSDKTMAALSLYDLSRLEVKKGNVYQGAEIYSGRYRMVRFERIADKTSAQIDQLRMLLKASLRLGRPIHVFRGLPVPQRAFFHHDAMPRRLADLLGGNSLRLEQIPHALEQLQLAQVLLETPGLGYDVLMRYANPHTRFGTLCLVWGHLRDELKNTQSMRTGGIRFVMEDLEKNFDQLLEEYTMNDREGALVQLGKAAARIQRRPSAQASISEEMLVFKLCLDFAEKARISPYLTDRTSLIEGITSDLEVILRKGKAAAREHRDNKTLREGCAEVATLFVDKVWSEILKGRSPTQSIRRILGSIYRMSFLHASRSRPEETTDSTTAVNS
jgi:hypothetical protein